MSNLQQQYNDLSDYVKKLQKRYATCNKELKKLYKTTNPQNKAPSAPTNALPIPPALLKTPPQQNKNKPTPPQNKPFTVPIPPALLNLPPQQAKAPLQQAKAPLQQAKAPSITPQKAPIVVPIPAALLAQPSSKKLAKLPPIKTIQQQNKGSNTTIQQQNLGTNTAIQQQNLGTNTAIQQQNKGTNTAIQQQNIGTNTATAYQHIDTLSPAIELRQLELFGKVNNDTFHLNRDYSEKNKTISLRSNEAFIGDYAYHYTIQKYGTKFCHNTLPSSNQCLRILSFNVHNFHKICEYNIVRKDPAYVASYINNVKPNLILLQEYVPYINKKYYDQNKNQIAHADQVTADLDFSYFDNLMGQQGYPESVKENDFETRDQNWQLGFLGKAVYSQNNTIKNADSRVLGQIPQTNMDRGYLRIIYKVPNRNKLILVYTVHLSFSKIFATKQEIENLIKAIDIEMAYYNIKSVIIMGDFNNEPLTTSDWVQMLRAKNFKLLNDNTPTAFNQNTVSGKAIDLVWVSRHLLDKYDICNQSNNNKYVVAFQSNSSDHYPIILDISPKK